MAKKASAKKAVKKAVKKTAKKATPAKSKKTPAPKAKKAVKKSPAKKAVKKAALGASAAKKKVTPAKNTSTSSVVKKAVVKKATPKPIKKAVSKPVKTVSKPVSSPKSTALATNNQRDSFSVSLTIKGFSTTINASPGQNNQLFFRYFRKDHQLQVDRVSGFTGGEQVLERNIGDSVLRSLGAAKSSPDLLRKVVLRHELIVIFRNHPVNDQHHGGDRVLFNPGHAKTLDVTRETNLATLLSEAHSAVHLVEPTVPLLHSFLEGNYTEDLTSLAVKIRIHLEADTEGEQSKGCYVELFLKPGPNT
jgi:hypothetical protein